MMLAVTKVAKVNIHKVFNFPGFGAYAYLTNLQIGLNFAKFD
jgi:hypothetical protein